MQLIMFFVVFSVETCVYKFLPAAAVSSTSFVATDPVLLLLVLQYSSSSLGSDGKGDGGDFGGVS